MARRRRRNPWISVSEVLVWVLFVALLFPAGFAGWAIGHYTSLGKSSGTRTVTVTAAATTQAATTQAAATTSAATTTSAAAPSANAAAGVSVFTSSGCGSCHTFKPAGANGAVGPDLDAKPKADAQKANMQLAAFVKQSIVDPNAYVSPGYPKGVMPGDYGTKLSKKQLDDLVAAIVKANG